MVLSNPGQMNTEQYEQNIQQQNCCRIPYQLDCFICGALLSNNSVLASTDARLDLFIEHDVYLCDKQMCCAHHLVGSHIAPDQTIDISHYESGSLTPSEAMNKRSFSKDTFFFSKEILFLIITATE